jgi:shikimate 5-dehydrogenase
MKAWKELTDEPDDIEAEALEYLQGTEGFAESLKAQAGDEDIDRACAVVLGAGGAGRAVVSALIDLGCGGIRIANRHR